MRCYKVGGCVRDRILGLRVKDVDWVVTGATVTDLTDKGFTQVGRDFPVFLHPRSKQEYALARTERKSGRGYTGFVVHAAPDVSLEDDLRRRDLTINAMAQDDDGDIIDPFGGQADLQKKLLRHVSPAFVEDPLRVLRVARFAARLGFTVAVETSRLMQQIVDSGELLELPVERVWREWQRALGESRPGLFFKVLAACGALDALLAPQFAAMPTLAALDATAGGDNEQLPRFAAHIAAASSDNNDWRGFIKSICKKYRIPKEYQQGALLVADCRWQLLQGALQGDAVFALLQRCDAFRRDRRFLQLQPALAAQAAALPIQQQQEWQQRLHLLAQAHNVAAAIGKDALPAGLQGEEISKGLAAKRLAAIYALFPN